MRLHLPRNGVIQLGGKRQGMLVAVNNPMPVPEGHMEELQSSVVTPDQSAVHWIRALPGGDYCIRAGFTSWLRSSALNVEAFLRQKMLETEFKRMDPDKQIDVQEFIKKGRAGIHTNGNVVAL